MLSFCAWSKDNTRFDELPTVRDVLAAADPALVADALYTREVALARSMGEEPPTLAEVWERTEATLKSILATPVHAADSERVLIASTTLRSERADDCLRISTEATLVMRGDLALYAHYLEGDYRPDSFSDEVPICGWAFESDPLGGDIVVSRMGAGSHVRAGGLPVRGGHHMGDDVLRGRPRDR